VVTTCMFCDSKLSIAMRLLHDRYCSTEHKEAYFRAMDRLGLERLVAAQVLSKSGGPCTKPLDLGQQMQSEPVHMPAEPKDPKLAKRMRPHLELAQGEAAAVAGL
jgi:hypothetical protein